MSKQQQEKTKPVKRHLLDDVQDEERQTNNFLHSNSKWSRSNVQNEHENHQWPKTGKNKFTTTKGVVNKKDGNNNAVPCDSKEGTQKNGFKVVPIIQTRGMKVKSFKKCGEQPSKSNTRNKTKLKAKEPLVTEKEIM